MDHIGTNGMNSQMTEDTGTKCKKTGGIKHLPGSGNNQTGSAH
jgi:hypothetical protein